MHLVIVKYENDAERKKIEYLIGKYGVKRVKDVVIEVDDSIFPSFIREFLGRIPEERIKVYEMSEKRIKPERVAEEIEESFDTDKDSVRQFMDYLMVRRRGNYRGKLGDFERYRIHTKKGFVDVSLRYSEDDRNTGVLMRIEGMPEMVKRIGEEMRKELENYKKSISKRR